MANYAIANNKDNKMAIFRLSDVQSRNDLWGNSLKINSQVLKDERGLNVYKDLLCV